MGRLLLKSSYDQGDRLLSVINAFYWYEKAAANGHKIAQYNLALKYEKEKDMKQAFSWCKKAAENGYFKAQDKLGSLYESHEGIVNHLEAFYWYQMAAENGYDVAQYNLDLEMSTYWYRQAATNGHDAAKYHLAFLYNECLEETFDKHKKAAEKGCNISQYNLAVLFEKENNPKQAFNWYLVAAENGNIQAQNPAGKNGGDTSNIETISDLDKVHHWYHEAANDDSKHNPDNNPDTNEHPKVLIPTLPES
ncbi:17712_t:CDS:2 [Funneliformis geosporum]|uniref:17712_t:CDS:1 n=1 Tax=Funneliformis geosporum TaxID=1117311 RepID=A0A9W4SKK2_9GLOM|nr:17712_t:CDS:2 [Funneliformis geosporum]